MNSLLRLQRDCWKGKVRMSLKPDSTVWKPGCITSGLGEVPKLPEAHLMFLLSKGEFGKRAKWDNTYKVPAPIRCDRLKACLGKMKIGLSTVTSGSFFS